MQTAADIEAKIRDKVDQDESFRERLLQDPRSAIKEVTGLTVPETFNLHVHEETSKDFHLVVPPKGGRLSDEELQQASGGYYSDSW